MKIRKNKIRSKQLPSRRFSRSPVTLAASTASRTMQIPRKSKWIADCPPRSFTTATVACTAASTKLAEDAFNPPQDHGPSVLDPIVVFDHVPARLRLFDFGEPIPMHPVVAVELFQFGFPIPQFDRVIWVAGYLLLGHGFVVGDQGAEVHLPLQDLVPPAGLAPMVSDPLELG